MGLSRGREKGEKRGRQGLEKGERRASEGRESMEESAEEHAKGGMEGGACQGIKGESVCVWRVPAAGLGPMSRRQR